MSGRLSPLKSAVATLVARGEDGGLASATNPVFAALRLRIVVPPPGSLKPATARSGLPSALKSAVTP
jgi:hypothetical protein